jgi:hypothetical protein
MAALTYYWVGSTAASINSFSWDVVANWKTLKIATGGSGGTAATLVAATRTPFGGDTVFFGRGQVPVSQYSTAPFQIHSPCLFGGVTTDGTPKAWAGTTAGSTTQEKYWAIQTVINPSYPFTKLGGQVSTSVLTEMTRALEFHRGEVYGTRGEWTRTGEEGESGTYWENRLYSGAGFTSGISFSAQPHYTIRFSGAVNDASRLNTTVTITGTTSGVTSGGVSSQQDGSLNRYGLMNYSQPYAYGVNVNSDSTAANGWSSGVPTEVGQPYKHGPTELYGHWNRIYAAHFIRGLDLSCVGVKVNAVILEPSMGYFFMGTAPGVYGVTQSTQFDVNSLYFDKDSSARYFGIKNIEQMHGEVTIHGDVIPTGGFVCSVPDGASAGNSGGIALANGSFTFTPPSKVSTEATTPTVRVGFPLSAGTKQSTTLTNAYFNAGGQSSVLTMDGNFTGTNCYINEGTIQFSASIPQNATVDISNLQLNGNSVLDMSLPALYTGNNNIKVITQSDAVTIKPGKGTAMTVSQTLIALTS